MKMSTLEKTMEKHAPIQYLSEKEIELKMNPWLTTGILKYIKIRTKYYKTFMKTKDKQHYAKYKIYRDKINHLIRASKTYTIKTTLHNISPCQTKTVYLYHLQHLLPLSVISTEYTISHLRKECTLIFRNLQRYHQYTKVTLKCPSGTTNQYLFFLFLAKY